MKFLNPVRPAIEAGTAEQLARDLYGRDGNATALYGERDRAFRIAAWGHPDILLRIFSAEEEPDTIAATLAALQHVERTDPGLNIPRPLAQRDGGFISSVEGTDGARHSLYAVTWLPGTIIGEVEATPYLLSDLGRSVARLGRALRGFYAPAFGRPFLWDARQAPDLLQLFRAPRRRRSPRPGHFRY
jgi:Ser/Thr protein kinase RdoA (MazF antagonist)